jgi:protein-disulfide isomerase
MKTLRLSTLTLALSLLTLSACVDTTGLSPDSKRTARGNPDAPVVVQEFADLQCPACAAAQDQIVKPLLEKYGQQVRFELHHYPLQSMHRYARDLGEAAECAADQGKFWEFVDLAFENQKDLAKGIWSKWAASLKLDTALFDRCVASHIKRKTVLTDYEQGGKIGVQGTPTFMVNGTKVKATINDISGAIDQLMGQFKTNL